MPAEYAQDGRPSANERNLSTDAVEARDQLPPDRVAYVHVAGGMERGGLYHDTQPVLEQSLGAEFDTLFDAYAREQPLPNLFQAARRPVAWTIATAIVAWLLTGIIDTLDRWMPRALAVITTAVGFIALAGGAVIGIRATIRSEVDKLRTALPAAAHELEQRYRAAADFHLAQRTQSLVTSLDDRFGVRAQVAAAAGTASTYVVTGVLTLFLVIYGPRFVSGALGQIRTQAGEPP